MQEMNTNRRYKTNRGRYRTYNAMLALNKEDYKVLYELYFKNTSIHRLARGIGVSRTAVRWRRDKALKKLKKAILRQAKNSKRIH